MSKFKFVLGLSFFSATAFANEMSSLTYFQKANEFKYDTVLAFTTLEYAQLLKLNNDVISSKYEDSIALWSHKLSFGVSDAFNFGLNINYFLSNKGKQIAETRNNTVYTGTAVPGTNTFSNFEANSSGLGDIDLSANYRLFNGNVNFDLLSSVSLSLGDAERGSNGENFNGTAFVNTEGNSLSGGHSLDIDGKLSGKVDSIEYLANVGLTYNLEKEVTVLSGAENQAGTTNTNQKLKVKSNIDFNLGGEAQFLLSESVSLGAGALINFYSKEKTSFDPYYTDGSRYIEESTTKARTDITLKLDAKFNLAKSMYVGAFFAHTFAGDRKISGSAVEDGTTTIPYTNTVSDLDSTVFGFNYAVTF